MNSPLDLRPMPQATQPWVGGIFYRAAAKAAMSVAPRLVRMASRPSVQPEPRCDVGVTGDADDRQDADGDDNESRKRALFEAAARSELVDIGRERLDIKRTQEQRRRQFLEAINEDQQRLPKDRRLGERQVDRAREGPWSRAEQACDVVELHRNARKSRLGKADRDGEEADHTRVAIPLVRSGSRGRHAATGLSARRDEAPARARQFRRSVS